MPSQPIIKLFAVFLVFAMHASTEAKKVLVFDEKTGIQWVDQKASKEEKFQVPEIKQKKKVVIIEESSVKVPDHVKTQPITAYILRETGQKFYFNNDFSEAKKYFARAWDMEKLPLDKFWLAAIYRKEDSIPQMTSILEWILVQHASSEVADDALFYLAVEDQKKGDYENALTKYRDVVEKYHDGISVIGKFPFREEARRQLRAIQADISSRLTLTGLTDGSLGELLRQFQRNNNLPISGLADSLTINTLIRLSDEKELLIRSGIAERHGAGNFRRIFLGTIALVLLTSIIWTARTINTINNETVRLKLLTKDFA